MAPLICQIKENSWLARLAARRLHTENMAVTIGSTIHLYKATRAEFMDNRKWVSHEICHVLQFRKYGLVRFLFLYSWETLRHGYRRNKFEIEALAAENDEGPPSPVKFRDC